MINKKINKIREELDLIDSQIIQLLSARMQKVADLGEIKKKLGLPPIDMKRWDEVLKKRIELAKKYDLSQDFIRAVWESIHRKALEIEEKI